MNKYLKIIYSFQIPIIVLTSVILHILFKNSGLIFFSTFIIYLGVIIGSFGTFKSAFISLSKGAWGVDYIAMAAILLSLITGEYVVAGILSLMVAGGKNLEEYAVTQAKKSLTLLANRIPTKITLWKSGSSGATVDIGSVKVGQEIFIKKGEVIGLDGTLVSEASETDESSLTGEPYFIEKIKGDLIRSGTINIGSPMIVKVQKSQEDSTYKKILDMVSAAQEEKSPMIRLADKYSTFFTLVTFAIAGFSYVYSGFDLSRMLSVLAVATPCPLIIATPIALLGGVNAASKKKIIIKKLSALEVLSRVNYILFDKTGTITLGLPTLIDIILKNKKYSQEDVLAIGAALERNSLHPVAKAIVSAAKEKQTKVLSGTSIEEKIGTGISGVIDGKKYTMSKKKDVGSLAVSLVCVGEEIAVFKLEDGLKQESQKTLARIMSQGIKLKVLTGDNLESTKKIIDRLGLNIEIKAQCSPQEKEQEIKNLKNIGKITAMVGDGINDAPALASADVGMVFGNQEQTAASEAAEVVFLGGDFPMVMESLKISQRTIRIAKQSIVWGIGLSIVAMTFSAFGSLSPIYGAGLQEVIDVAVIVNALRASK